MTQTQTLPAVPPSASRHEIAWEEMFDRHQCRVRDEIRRRLLDLGEPCDRERLDDLAQEVWCHLLRRDRRDRPGPRLANEGETANYMRSVARTVVLDRLRYESARSRTAHGAVSLQDVPWFDTLWIDRRSCPERRADARSTLRAYLAICRSLLGRGADSAGQVRVRMRALRLAWFLGLSSVDVARRLGGGWTTSRVDSLLHRVRGRLTAHGLPVPVRPTR